MAKELRRRCMQCGIWEVLPNPSHADERWWARHGDRPSRCRCTLHGDVRDFVVRDRVKHDGARFVVLAVDYVGRRLSVVPIAEERPEATVIEPSGQRWLPAGAVALDW